MGGACMRAPIAPVSIQDSARRGILSRRSRNTVTRAGAARSSEDMSITARRGRCRRGTQPFGGFFAAGVFFLGTAPPHPSSHWPFRFLFFRGDEVGRTILWGL